MLLTTLFIIGIVAEAATGALAAGRQKMDLFGVTMIATVTALGGGSARDVLLGHYPLTWVKNPHYLLIVAATAIIAVSISWLMRHFRRLFLVLDAVGLSAFTVIGANVALEMGHGPIIAVVSALLTGIMGGVLRDILCNRLPLVFHKELYATVVLIGAVVYLIMREVNIDERITVVTALLVTFLTRMIALKFRLSLPVFDYQSHEYARPDWTRIWPARVRRLRFGAGKRKSEGKTAISAPSPDRPDSTSVM